MASLDHLYLQLNVFKEGQSLRYFLSLLKVQCSQPLRAILLGANDIRCTTSVPD